MEEIRRAADVHVQNMLPSERADVFRKLRAIEDGRISLDESTGCFEWIPLRKISSLFCKLDTDRSGFLELHEFVTLQYVIDSRPICDSCMEIVTGLYFCCVRCWEKHENGGGVEFQSYEVCSNCYYARWFRYDHDEFLNNYAMSRPKLRSVTWREEEALKAGRLYFQSVASIGPDLSVARKLFNEMDLNEDGTVSSSEVVDFIVRKGKMEREKARRIYLNIDMMENANHTLEDVAALWYVWLMRPRCNGCEALIMGSYYSCVDCFRSRNFSHQHGNFLDNYVLLYQKNQQQENLRPQSMVSSLSVPQATQITEKWSMRKALKTITTGVAAGVIAEVAGGAVLRMVCTIM